MTSKMHRGTSNADTVVAVDGYVSVAFVEPVVAVYVGVSVRQSYSEHAMLADPRRLLFKFQIGIKCRTATSRSFFSRSTGMRQLHIASTDAYYTRRVFC